MQEQPQQKTFDLVRRVRAITMNYILHRSEDRSGISYNSFRNKVIIDPETNHSRLQVPDAYRTAREKVCADVFYALRACRTREDFVEYFVGTLCSVPQFLPENEYLGLSAVLLERDDRWQDARALAMLTVSALWSIGQPENG
jgi:CRISPR-associated protein Cmx8